MDGSQVPSRARDAASTDGDRAGDRAGEQVAGQAARVAAAAVLAFVVALLAKLPQLGFAHREPDEVVYWQLAQRLWQDGVYSLRGTRILELLPASMYDHPVFHHPPLLPALLGPFAARSAELYPPGAALWIVWLAHAGAAAATLLVAARMARGALGLLPLACVAGVLALEPIGWFAARFLWIDALSLAAAALAAALGLGARSRARLALAGACAALAALAKLTGLVVLPFLVADLVRRAPPRGALAALLAPPLVLVGGYLAWFAWQTGAVLPTWIAPDASILARDALMREGFERSPLAYLWLVPLVQPLALWTVLAYATAPAETRRRCGVLAAWCLVGGAAIAATSLLGTTPVQTRQLAAVLPALHALACVLFLERRQPAWRATFVLSAACAVASGVASVHGRNVYEPTPFWELLPH
jgi:hypothetical protein